MEKEEYGEKYHEHLIEQYKLYVDTTNRITDSRVKTIHFYLSLTSALLGLLAFIIEKKIFPQAEVFITLTITSLGILLCFVWYINLESYRQLNSGKFSVIRDMELHLPHPCFRDEWDKYLGKGTPKKYLRLTKIEKYIPILMAFLYITLIVYISSERLNF